MRKVEGLPRQQLRSFGRGEQVRFVRGSIPSGSTWLPKTTTFKINDSKKSPQDVIFGLPLLLIGGGLVGKPHVECGFECILPTLQ